MIDPCEMFSVLSKLLDTV